MPHRPQNERPQRLGIELAALGNQLRTLRTVRGWTLEVAAEQTNIDWKHLQKIEAGAVNVTMLTLVRISEGYDVPLWVLFRGAS